MEIKDLENKLIAVVGYGIEGKSVTNYLISKGLKPVLFDQKPWSQWSLDDQSFIKNANLNFIFSPDAFIELKGFDIIFRSPGIKISDIKNYVSKNAIITSQTKWFFDHCPAKIIGVTGTKGKGTTSALIYQMLLGGYSQVKTYLTGNIGKIQPFEILDNIKSGDYVVYELSSFQLQDLTKSPHIGVVLMVTSEHLDYHENISEYVEAKFPISQFQKEDDFLIYNPDYANTVKIANSGKAKKILVSRKQVVANGCYAYSSKIFLNGLEFLNINTLQLPGAHNLENVCAAIAVADSLGCSKEVIKQTVINFKGLEHRLEFVCENSGIKFYNDSFSTTPETSIAAINSFTNPEIVILGGSEKKSDFTEFVKCIANSNNIKAVILIGQEASRLKQLIFAMNKATLNIYEGATNMEQIFDQIKMCAKSGDLVILSPACASFGMFKNYKDRGEQFKQMAVNF